MIVGMGTDLIKISRIEHSLSRFGDDFAKRVLTPDEFNIYLQHKNKPTYVASRFAVKEAVVKAFGTGFSQGIYFSQIGVKNNPAGKPELYFSGKALEFYQQQNYKNAHVSITHEKDYALVFVVLEKL